MSRSARSASATTIDGGPSGEGPLELVALAGNHALAVHDLPAEGALTIGRGVGSDVDLPDPRVSRRHARLTVAPGPALDVEDLGSNNGTLVRGRRLIAGERAVVALGEPIFVGSTVLLARTAAARSRGARARERAIGEPERLRATLDEICARGAGSDTAASIVLFEMLDGSFATAALELVGDRLDKEDVVAAYPGGRYAALVVSTATRSSAHVESSGGSRGRALVEALAALGPGVVAIEACFPYDGVTAEALLDEAERRLEDACLAAAGTDHVAFASPALQRLYELARHAAAGDVNVLLLGETGVGKDVLARAIHRLSPRAGRTFRRIDCAALAEPLVESELYGHERGAFTGAVKAKPGLIELAHGGTVFLDEVGELPPRLQAKLLHLLETRTVTRVGAVAARTIDVRFVASTNRTPEEEIAAGRFRKDLYYRLAGFTLLVPPLRERRDDILPLARAFLRDTCRRTERAPAPRLSPEAVARLEAWAWPGNARELRNVIERAVLVCSGPRIEESHLLFEGASVSAPVAAEAPASAALGAPTLVPGGRREPEERRRIEAALAACGGNQTRAARLLGMARSTLALRLDAYEILRPLKPSSKRS